MVELSSRKQGRGTWLAFASLLALGLPLAVTATSLEPATTAEIARTSTRIVHARCTGVETRRVEQYGNNLFTFFTFEVLDRALGDIPDSFTIRLFGGEMGDLRIDVPLMPTFKTGEEVVLLLGADNRDGHPIIDPQGVLRTTIDPQSGKAYVTSPVTGVPLFRACDGEAYANSDTKILVRDLLFSLRKQLGES